MQALFRNQPHSFYMIFMLEIWERFGFYTLQGLIVVFFIRELNLTTESAYLIFGAFSAITYGLVVIGGYVGDKILGTKRTIFIGLIILALGYLSLAVANNNLNIIFLSLATISVGNGLFKANPSNLLAKSYSKNDPNLHAGFTLYYLAINVGAIIALLIGPTLSIKIGYPFTFALSFFGILLGITNYLLHRKDIALIHTQKDNAPLKAWEWCLFIVVICLTIKFTAFLLYHPNFAKIILIIITILTLTGYLYYLSKENKTTQIHMLVALLFMVQGIIFFTLYLQMPTSLNLFAIYYVTPKLLNITLEPQSFQALNPFWIIILGPIFSCIYRKSHAKGYASIPLAYKFSLGMISAGAAFGLLYFAKFFTNAEGHVSALWLIASYFFQSISELLISALGAAMMAELVPKHMLGFAMGMWFLTTALAGFTGAYVASKTLIPQNLAHNINTYTDLFGTIGLATLIIGCIMSVLAFYLVKKIPTLKN